MTDTRHEFARLEAVYLPIAIAVFTIVLALLVFALVRYRRRRPDQIGSQRRENNPLELVYATVLAAIAAFLIAMTFTVEDRTDAVAKRPGLEVRIVASQWTWRFEYPRYGKVSQSPAGARATLYVPTGTEVDFTGRSVDVVHSFYIPERRFKRDLFPGDDTRFSLLWPSAGRSRGECAEFCGLLHANMDFSVVALPPAQFDRWVRR